MNFPSAALKMLILGAALLSFGPALSEGAERDSGKLTIVAFGDSTTAGTPGFLSPLEAPPDGQGNEESQYTYWMRKLHPEWRVLNRGVNGERSDQIARRFERDVAAENPDLMILLAGVNDLFQGYPAEHVASRIREISAMAEKLKIQIMLCTILPYNISTPEVKKRMDEANEWIHAYARERGFLFCDTFALVNDPSRPGNLVSTPDGLHPDVSGYRKMGEAIAAVVSGRHG